jgi:hypothetical protein|nr:MAG TPA: hypothetical protein [Caudoviricetes sp.]
MNIDKVLSLPLFLVVEYPKFIVKVNVWSRNILNIF